MIILYQSDCYRKPLIPSQYPATNKPINSLRRCECGRMTFLNLPCEDCGKMPSKLVFEDTNLSMIKYQTTLFGVAIAGGVCLAIAAWMLLNVVWAIISLVLTIAVLALMVLFIKSVDQTDSRYYWKFHSNIKPLFTVENKSAAPLEPSTLEPIIDSWYLDISRLERLALKMDWEAVQSGISQLASVFRNPRLSRLQYNYLLNTGFNIEDEYMLDELCMHIQCEDIADKDIPLLLRKMAYICRYGNCNSQNHIKRLFIPLFLRYIKILQKNSEFKQMSDCIGVSLFEYCGGIIHEQEDKIPSDEDGEKLFFDRLITELYRYRQEYVDSGKWYFILKFIKNMDTENAKKAFWRINKLFLRNPKQSEAFFHSQHRSYRSENKIIFLIHPEILSELLDMVQFWQIDNNGKLYTSSDIAVIRFMAETKFNELRKPVGENVTFRTIYFPNYSQIIIPDFNENKDKPDEEDRVVNEDIAENDSSIEDVSFEELLKSYLKQQE